MKKILNIWLMAALVCGLSLIVSSCKDDDDKGSNIEEVDATETDEAVAALRWLVALTDTRDLADNWASRTYEPTVGQASSQNPLNRVKLVNDLDEAKADFAALAGIGVEGLDGVKTVTDRGVGSLTWTPSAAGADNLATVDVSSSLLPGLRQIIYCTSDQVGKNGVFFDNVKGTAYYRFGDVVEDKEGFYWVCVRPCFAPDKGDSHWINIFNAAASGGSKKIPEKYLQKKWDNKSKYNNAPIILPTKLPAHLMHTHNLSQLIQALLRPDEYEATYKKNSKYALGGFDAKYNGRRFIEKVALYWDQTVEGSAYNVWQLLFNHSGAQMRNLYEIAFVNQGYSWGMFSGTEASVIVYKSHEYRTMFKSSEDYLKFDVTRGFDVRAFAGDPDASKNIGNEMKQIYTAAGGNQYGRWVIRYASGKDLANTILTPSPYEPLANTTNVYVYNLKTNRNVRTPLETEEELGQGGGAEQNAVELGSIIGADGKFYANKLDAEEKSGSAVAVVVALSDKAHPLEDGTTYTGMAMSLNQTAPAPMNAKDGYKNDCGLDKSTTTWAEFQKHLNGLSVTQKMAAGCGKNHDHPAIDLCYNYASKLTDAGKTLHNYSEWFMPSFGQWLVAVQAVGYVLPTSGADMNLYKDNVLRLTEFCNNHGLVYNDVFTMFYTCTLFPGDEDDSPEFILAAPVFLTSFNSLTNADATSNLGYRARPFILFEK